MSGTPLPAPPWRIERWFNTARPLDLPSLRGRVIVLGAFQMLCPGCVTYLIPQLQEVRKSFDQRDVAVIGLHTVFEHHAAMSPVSLEAFLHEYQVRFPVGVDQAGAAGNPLPETMAAYAMRGTPTMILIDREGHLRRQVFGHMPNLTLGAEIGALLREGGEVGPGATAGAAGAQTPSPVCRVN